MIESSTLIPLVESLSGKAVLCVGDTMLDRYVYGTVERISPESPVPILRVDREMKVLGGAGNVLRNLLALGAQASIVTVLGDDAAADDIEALLAECGNSNAVFTKAPGRKTTVKNRFLASSQQMLRCDWESVEPLPTPSRLKILTTATEMMPDHAVLLLSDYAKGAVNGRMARDLITAAHHANRLVVVDPKGPDYDRYRGADIITPNRRELEEAVGRSLSSGEETDAAKDLAGLFGFGAVIVTLGRDGMVLATRDGETAAMPTNAREVFDVSGAGDTAAAVVAAAMAAGASIHQAAELANVAAGIVVGKVGTAVAYSSELVQALHRHDLSRAETKLLALEPVRDRIAVWRRQGMKIGFKNGCFDLLHPGHVSLLAQARAACDRLVVGLNNDDSVARLKGPSRPFQSEAARATVLASLASVDIVVMFSDDTPLELIKALRPDVLIKGADYRIDQIVGADVVQAYGGQVLLANVEPGFSTSATIERIAK